MVISIKEDLRVVLILHCASCLPFREWQGLVANAEVLDVYI